MQAYHEDSRLASGNITTHRQESPDTQQRTRATTWVPRRAYYVLRYLRRVLTAGRAQALSNKAIQVALGFGSEGEISQIMRWLAGEQPTAGRWSYAALSHPQAYQFIARDRLPTGAYAITLLPTPRPIEVAPLELSPFVQLSFFGVDSEKNDPAMIPHAPRPNASQGGSFFHDPPDAPDPPRSNAPNARSQGDHAKHDLKESKEEEEVGRSPLFARLVSEPRMDRQLARRIAETHAGTVADFDADLKIAKTFARDPYFFTVAKWKAGQRVLPPNAPCTYPARSAKPMRRPMDEPLNPADYAHDPLYRLGSDTSGLDVPPPEMAPVAPAVAPPEAESYRDHAARLLPPPTAETLAMYSRDLMYVQMRLGMHDSDAQALAALAAYRKTVRR